MISVRSCRHPWFLVASVVFNWSGLGVRCLRFKVGHEMQIPMQYHPLGVVHTAGSGPVSPGWPNLGWLPLRAVSAPPVAQPPAHSDLVRPVARHILPPHSSGIPQPLSYAPSPIATAAAYVQRIVPRFWTTVQPTPTVMPQPPTVVMQTFRDIHEATEFRQGKSLGGGGSGKAFRYQVVFPDNSWRNLIVKQSRTLYHYQQEKQVMFNGIAGGPPMTHILNCGSARHRTETGSGQQLVRTGPFETLTNFDGGRDFWQKPYDYHDGFRSVFVEDAEDDGNLKSV